MTKECRRKSCEAPENHYIGSVRSARHNILCKGPQPMRCPFCASEESRVVDSRESESGDAIRRRRECIDCERRYTTYERVDETPLVVIKRSGAEEVFTRAKLLNGLLRACEKRGIALERVERIADDIEGELRRESIQHVSSVEIGERALRALGDLDRVAYIRFASVYRQFEDIEEFEDELIRLESLDDRVADDQGQADDIRLIKLQPTGGKGHE